MNKPRVLYLTYDGLTDPLGQSQILPYLFGLATRYAITIISFEKTDRFVQIKKSIQLECESNGLEWCPLEYHKRPPILSTLYDIWLLRRLAFQLHQARSFSLIHCRSYLTALVGLQMKRKYGIGFIFDMRGFWADERIEVGIWNLKNPIFKLVYKFFKRKEQDFLREARYVVVLTEAAHVVLKQWGVRVGIKVIPCCVDMKLFDPLRFSFQHRQDLRAQLGILPADFVICYVGSLGTWYKYAEMITFYEAFRNLYPQTKMLFITPHKSYVRNENFIVRTATRQQIPEYLSICQASICFINTTFSKQGSSATKIAEALAMGVPVIVNGGWGDTNKLIEQYHGGVMVNSWRAEDFVHAATKLRDQLFPSEKIRQIAMDYFSLDIGIKHYLEIYDACISRYES